MQLVLLEFVFLLLAENLVRGLVFALLLLHGYSRALVGLVSLVRGVFLLVAVADHRLFVPLGRRVIVP